MPEQWRAIPGCGDKYFISSAGQIISANKKRGILRQWFRGDYLVVELIFKTHSVHRLAALTFIPNPNNKPYINHKNGIKTDNRIENLEWCTRSENAKHMYATGLRKKIFGEQNPCAKHSDSKIMEVLLLLSRKIPQRKISKLTAVPQSTIFAINKGKFRKNLKLEFEQSCLI